MSLRWLHNPFLDPSVLLSTARLRSRPGKKTVEGYATGGRSALERTAIPLGASFFFYSFLRGFGIVELRRRWNWIGNQTAICCCWSCYWSFPRAGLTKECKRLQSYSDYLHSSSFSWKQINDVVAELELRGFSMTPSRLENKKMWEYSIGRCWREGFFRSADFGMEGWTQSFRPKVLGFCRFMVLRGLPKTQRNCEYIGVEERVLGLQI
jgi:hypothetical protein